MLQDAKEYGDYLIVVVARDQTVCKVKGRPPVNDENIRLKNLEAMGIAQKVRLGCLDDHYRAIAEEKPNIVALGYDQKVFVDNLEKAIDPHTQIVRLAPFQPEIYKSSKLREKM